MIQRQNERARRDARIEHYRRQMVPRPLTEFDRMRIDRANEKRARKAAKLAASE